MPILSITIPKVYSGKTNTAINLAAAVQLAGKKVLVEPMLEKKEQEKMKSLQPKNNSSANSNHSPFFQKESSNNFFGNSAKNTTVHFRLKKQSGVFHILFCEFVKTKKK